MVLLLSDMAWTITFSLLASLIVALTVVPCAEFHGAEKAEGYQAPEFDKALNGYEKLLRASACAAGAVPLTPLAIVLLGVSIWRVATMGVVMIPDTEQQPADRLINVPDDTARRMPSPRRTASWTPS